MVGNKKLFKTDRFFVDSVSQEKKNISRMEISVFLSPLYSFHLPPNFHSFVVGQIYP